MPPINPPVMQEQFDQMVKHMFRQASRAENACGKCKLRTWNGLSCVVGSLIPDKEYKPELEHFSLGDLVDRVPALFGSNVSFLSDMQAVHDNHDPSDWPEELRWVTGAHGLDGSVLEKGISDFKRRLASD